MTDWRSREEARPVGPCTAREVCARCGQEVWLEWVGLDYIAAWYHHEHGFSEPVDGADLASLRHYGVIEDVGPDVAIQWVRWMREREGRGHSTA